jgi:hypothetical protein
VQRAHDAGQHGAVADAGVEDPERRRLQVAEFERIRCATSVFSLQVETNSRYFCRLSKNRKPGGAIAVAAPLTSFSAADGMLGSSGVAELCSDR